MTRADRTSLGESESGWGDDTVKCPNCDYEYGDLFELHDGCEMECYGCDAVLEWSTEASCTWKVEAFKRSDEEVKERAEKAAQLERDREKWRLVAERRERILKTKLDDLGIPPTWAEYSWPEWVPEGLRTSIEEFWLPAWGRSPREWMRSAFQNHAPALGSHHVVDRDTLYEVAGRYVHAWNNMGRLVTPSGDIVVVSCGRSGLYYRAKTTTVPTVADRSPSLANTLLWGEVLA